MTIKEALKKYSSIEIEILLSHILGKSKEFLYMNRENKLTIKQLSNLAKLIKRREKGEPIAYILGYKDFCGLRFKVNKDVLIPRPETEELVHKVLQVYKAGKPLRILDLGTGSGCIAISILKGLGLRAKGIGVVASDISAKALAIAKQNAKKNIHTRLYECEEINFIKSDLFKNITGKFDVIVANLPYVPLKLLHRFIHHKPPHPGPLPQGEREGKAVDDPFQGLKFEPAFALTDGTSSWQIYRQFFEQVGGHVYDGVARRFIGKSGQPINGHATTIFLEIDPSSRKFLTEYQKKYLPGWQIKFYKDFNNLWRYAEVIPKPGA